MNQKQNTNIKNKKPVFYHNNDFDKEIKAGGILFYIYDKVSNELKFLMINCNNRYEDFGGKTDHVDCCVEDTIAREVYEESNYIFEKDIMISKLKKRKPIYTKNSKYLLYLCKLKKKECYDASIFGDKEIHENIPRTIEWIPYHTLLQLRFLKNKLNFRLKSQVFFRRIEKLHNKYVRQQQALVAQNYC